MIGLLLILKPLLVVQIERRLTNTGNGDGDEGEDGKGNGKKGNLRYVSLRDSRKKRICVLYYIRHHNLLAVQNRAGISSAKIFKT